MVQLIPCVDDIPQERLAKATTTVVGTMDLRPGSSTGALDRLFRKIELRAQLLPAEKEALALAAHETRSVPGGVDIVGEEDRPRTCTLLVSGLAARYNITEQGGRQITAMRLPGDFVDLHSFLLKKTDHAVCALVPCTTVAFEHAELERVTSEFPRLIKVLWMLTLLDSAVHRKWQVAMGRTSALSNVAHFMCETYTRLEAVGLAADRRMKIDLTQVALADMLGLSAVHLNRVVQQLRTKGLVKWGAGEIHIHDWDQLSLLGEFDGAHLFTDPLAL